MNIDLIFNIIGILFVWSIASVIWFVYSLGRKNSKGRWYDWVFYPPLAVILFVYVFFARRKK